MSKTLVTIFDNETANRIINLAQQTGRTKSFYVRKAVEDKLDDLELIYLAQSRVENVRAGSTLSWE